MIRFLPLAPPLGPRERRRGDWRDLLTIGANEARGKFRQRKVHRKIEKAIMVTKVSFSQVLFTKC